MRTNSCPCCGGSLLRHIRHSGVYWFCRSCWQQIPTFEVSQSRNNVRHFKENQVLYSHVKKAPLVPCTWLRKAHEGEFQFSSNYMS